ncbi:hypothetical protein [Brachybacterium aquaticum]|uniref:Uncharacterized protein n=1 Tax=Brachybacterium aquaticum TaxID=1432564 RepID=A0A841AI60_9MICO|nr:hypothetical protein [Brachybacterium aquaticum]MBB5832942.1 hypothetical protein [Brachybacterium aquaticum]
MRTLFTAAGTVLGWIVLAPLWLAVMVVLLPIAAVFGAVEEVLAMVRREPRVRLPETGVVLIGGPEEETSREIVATAILSQCSSPVSRRVGEDGDITLTAQGAAQRRVVVRRVEELSEQDDEIGEELEVDIGPWTVNSPDGYDNGEGDVAVAMAATYLDRGLVCRVVGKRTVALLRWEGAGFEGAEVDEAGVWWRPEADGGGPFNQEWFRDLPGRPATEAERPRHLARDVTT